jgi:DNA-binding MarR family transcriptional regulator
MSSIAEHPAPEVSEQDGCPACLTGNLNWLLTKAHYALASELAAAFTPLGITPRAHAVLAAAATGAYTQKALADMVGLDKTTMVATIDELERAEFARRVPSPNDRRAHLIEVSALGMRTVMEANEIVGRVQADVLASLGDQVGDALLGMLANLVSARLAEPASCGSVRRREPRATAAL